MITTTKKHKMEKRIDVLRFLEKGTPKEIKFSNKEELEIKINELKLNDSEFYVMNELEDDSVIEVM